MRALSEEHAPGGLPLALEQEPRDPRCRADHKGAIVVAVAVSILRFFFCVGPVSTGRGAGFFFLMPVVASHGVWKTASALTRAQPYFQPRVFWLAAFVLAGIVLASCTGSCSRFPR